MKDNINNYNQNYIIATEIVSPSTADMIIVKATITTDKENPMKPTRVFNAHASGFISEDHAINSIELEAINRAMSLI